jgi:two-component system, chemotaxis family, CheB/CheR fusion protein
VSLKEEFVSMKDELESAGRTLQPLNQELPELNQELRLSLERQRQTGAALANLLISTPVAMILLDAELRIKIFNPPMRLLFSLIDGDIGRPLADLAPKFADPQLLVDAAAARSTGTASEREILAQSGTWHLRSVLPCRTEAGGIEGAVITFADVSRLKRAEPASTAAAATPRRS